MYIRVWVKCCYFLYTIKNHQMLLEVLNLALFISNLKLFNTYVHLLRFSLQILCISLADIRTFLSIGRLIIYFTSCEFYLPLKYSTVVCMPIFRDDAKQNIFLQSGWAAGATLFGNKIQLLMQVFVSSCQYVLAKMLKFPNFSELYILISVN